MKGFLRAYFSFSKSETRSIIAILIVLLISFFFRIIVKNWPYPVHHPDPVLLQEIIDLVNNLEKEEFSGIAAKSYSPEISSQVIKNHNSAKADKFLLKNFDPNIAETDDLISIGLSREIALNITKYRNAGGRFKKQEDIKKIYGMNDSVYSIIKDYIVINESTIKSFSFPRMEKQKLNISDHDILLNLNLADSSELKQLKNIGPVFASRIIKYRELLGGFYSHDQLNEVIGMDSVKFRSLLKHTFIDTLLIKKININTVNETTLKTHPYIRSYYAKSLMYYREVNGQIRRLEELTENNVLTTELYEKCKWYLSPGDVETIEK